jgi:hypothetical protein
MSLQPVLETGSHDGRGAGDRDAPFTFGRRPWTAATYPFSTRQYAWLLMRSRVEAELLGGDDRRAA